jgi:hypothetical protein
MFKRNKTGGKKGGKKGQKSDDAEGDQPPPPPPDEDDLAPPPPQDDYEDDYEDDADLQPGVEYDPPEGTEFTVVVPEDEHGSVGMEVEDDCTIVGFTEGSTAKKAGVEVGAVITAVDGTQCRNKAQLIDLIVARPEEETELEFTLIIPELAYAEEKPPQAPAAPAAPAALAPAPAPRATGHNDAPAQFDEPMEPPPLDRRPEPEPEPEPQPRQEVHLLPAQEHTGTGQVGNRPQQTPDAPTGDAWEHLEAQALGQWGSGTGAAPSVQKLEWATGASWDGQTRDGWYEGAGRMTYHEGTEYKGTYLNGKRHGTGTARMANGDSYDGTWAFGHFHGMGRYRWANNDEYIGPFENGKEHGADGVRVWVDEYGIEIGRYEGECVRTSLQWLSDSEH